MRRAVVRVLYDGRDITGDVSSCLDGFTYTDNASGKADTIGLDLEDVQNNWVGPWFPQQGARVYAAIECQDWEGPGDSPVLECGVFELDRVEFSGPPDILKIDGVSAATTSAARREKKSRAHESTSLKDLAQGVADREGYELKWESGQDVRFNRVDQRGESDLEFVQRLAESRGLHVKVTDGQLTVFDGEEFDAKPAAFVIQRGDGYLKSYRFSAQSAETYDSCKAEYWSPEEKKLYAIEHKPKKKPRGTGQTLKINERFESQAEAEAVAKKKLRKKNKGGVTGSVELRGHPGMQSGVNVQVVGFGAFDGKYSIETATHKVDRNGGYTTSLQLKHGMNSDGETDVEAGKRADDFTPEERKLYAVEYRPKKDKKTTSKSTADNPKPASAAQPKLETPTNVATDSPTMQSAVQKRYTEAVKSGDTAKAEGYKKFATQKGYTLND